VAVGTAVGVRVAVGIAVGVRVAVGIAVGVRVAVGIAVGELVAVAAGVLVAVGVEVEVAGGVTVLVGFDDGFTAAANVGGTSVLTADGVGVGGKVAVAVGPVPCGLTSRTSCGSCALWREARLRLSVESAVITKEKMPAAST
jgi:hypothetical protein